VKVVTVVGARPQFIKAAAVSSEIAAYNSSHHDHRTIIKEIIVHTGQHFDANISDIFFEEMKIPRSRHKLQINSMSHWAMTGRMLEKIEEILLYEKRIMSWFMEIPTPHSLAQWRQRNSILR
jgi:UDP-GlcNAc3NAcA epimerase